MHPNAAAHSPTTIEELLRFHPGTARTTNEAIISGNDIDRVLLNAKLTKMVSGSALGRRVLDQLGGLVTPDRILRWYRELIADKYDGTARRGCGLSGTAASL